MESKSQAVGSRREDTARDTPLGRAFRIWQWPRLGPSAQPRSKRSRISISRACASLSILTGSHGPVDTHPTDAHNRDGGVGTEDS